MKNTKKILSILLIGVLLLSLAGCKGKESAIDKIKENGKLVMATSADYPPFEFHALIDGKDTIEGFDIFVAREIAKELDVELEIIDLDFGTLVASLSAGKADIVLAAMTPDEERRESVDFSNLYYLATQAVITTKGNETSINTLEDLSGKTIGVQQGTIQADIALDPSLVSSPKEVKEVPKITDLVLMLQTGKVDAIIMELPVAESYVNVNDNLALTSVVHEDPDGGFSVAIRKNNSDFVQLVNNVLEKLESENKMEEFFIKASELAEQQQ